MKAKDIVDGARVLYAIGSPTQYGEMSAKQGYVIGVGWQRRRFSPNWFECGGRGVAVARLLVGGSTWIPDVVPLSHILRPWDEHLEREENQKRARVEAVRVRDKKRALCEEHAQRIIQKCADLGIAEKVTFRARDSGWYASLRLDAFENVIDRLIVAEEE